MAQYDKLTQEKMNKAIDGFHHVLTSIRTGRANPSVLNDVEVDYYGAMTPVNQMGQISVVEGTQLVIKLYDNSMLKDVEKAINAANLGLTPQNDGTVIRINVPRLTEDTRKDLAKSVSKYAEDAKIAIRNIRRDMNDLIKKDDELAEDSEKRELDGVQKVTDDFVKQIGEIAEAKVKEIMTI